jgi:hypothetical protein
MHDKNDLATLHIEIGDHLVNIYAARERIPVTVSPVRQGAAQPNA